MSVSDMGAATEVAARAAAALTVQGVRKTFEAENAPVRALRGVDLAVGQNDFIALMGPSGCGKSTLLNLVAGLDRPDEGQIWVADEEVTGRSEDDLARLRRRHIGLVFQFFNLLEGMTVLENVALPAVIAGRKRKMAETRARDLLDLLGIGDKATAVPGVLSGGQRQRLAIARALANEPTLLLADEPTGALDSQGGAEVMELLRRLHRGGQTIIMVTHDPEVASAAGACGPHARRPHRAPARRRARRRGPLTLGATGMAQMTGLMWLATRCAGGRRGGRGRPGGRAARPAGWSPAGRRRPAGSAGRAGPPRPGPRRS